MCLWHFTNFGGSWGPRGPAGVYLSRGRVSPEKSIAVILITFLFVDLSVFLITREAPPDPTQIVVLLRDSHYWRKFIVGVKTSFVYF